MSTEETTKKPVRKRTTQDVKNATEEMAEHRKKYAIVSDGKGGVKQIER